MHLWTGIGSLSQIAVHSLEIGISEFPHGIFETLSVLKPRTCTVLGGPTLIGFGAS